MSEECDAPLLSEKHIEVAAGDLVWRREDGACHAVAVVSLQQEGSDGQTYPFITFWGIREGDPTGSVIHRVQHGFHHHKGDHQ